MNVILGSVPDTELRGSYTQSSIVESSIRPWLCYGMSNLLDHEVREGDDDKIKVVIVGGRGC